MSYKWKVVTIAIVGSFMVVLDQTIVNIALPHIITVFNDTVDRTQLVVSAYLMATAISAPLAAFFSTRYGIKRVYLMSQAGFLIGSILCGVAWNTHSLVLFRVIQGLCGGLLSPLTMTFLFTNVPHEERGIAMSIFGIPMMLAPAIGPTLGGYLVTDVDWRWCFYVNVPVVIGALLLGLAWIKDTPLSKLSFDIKGFALATVGFSTLLFALSYAPSWGWHDTGIVSIFAISGISLVAWVIVELRTKSPLLDLRMFAFRGYSLATILNFVVTLSLFSSVFLLPLFLQNLRGLTALNTGLMLVPQALGSMISMPISGRIYDRIGPRIPVLVGLLIAAATTFWFRTYDVTTADLSLQWVLFFRGMGLGFAMMPIFTFALAEVPIRLTSQASSLTNVARTLFASLGTAMFASMLDNFHKTNLDMYVQAATPDSSLIMRLLSQVQVAAMQAGLSFDAARQFAVAEIYQYVDLRAYVTAFNGCFLVAAIIVFCGILPGAFLYHVKSRNGNKIAEVPLG